MIKWILSQFGIEQVINLVAMLIMALVINFQISKIDTLKAALLTQTVEHQQVYINAAVRHVQTLSEALNKSERYRQAADSATADLIKTVDSISARRNDIKKEISNAKTVNRYVYGLSADGLRLYLASFGYSTGADKNTVRGNSTRVITDTHKASRAGAGLSERDLLAHAADYGAYCQRLERQLAGINEYVEATQ
jgi:hypothetical protein